MAKRVKISEFSKGDLEAIRVVAKELVGKVGILSHEQEDIEQQLAISLYHESKNYLKREGTWTTFRGKILRSMRSKIIRARVQKSSKYHYNTIFSLNEQVNTANESTTGAQDYIDLINEDGVMADGTEKPEIVGLSLKIDIAIFILTLPNDLQEICELLKFYTKKEVAQKLGISRPTLDTRIEIIKKGMIEHGFTVYF